jgi:uncharacterized protein YpmS
MLVLACKIDAGGPTYTKGVIPISTEAAGSLEDTIKSAVKGGTDNSIVAFTLNESQLTSYLAYQLAKSNNPILQEVQVELHDDQITLYGISTQGIISASVMLTLLPQVNADGSIQLNIINADAGPIQAPQSTLDRISNEINAFINNQFSPVSDHFRVKTIYIADGMITIGGEIIPITDKN